MSKAAEKYGVLCDTGFLIRLNKPDDPLHANARAYLKYLIEGEHALYVSTIALAEYAVRDEIKNLPMRYFRVLPFNIDHAQKAGEFARIVFSKREQIPADITQRVIIPNDTKMFAQADVNPAITHYLTADQRCTTVFNLIQDSVTQRFKIIPLVPRYFQWVAGNFQGSPLRRVGERKRNTGRCGLEVSKSPRQREIPSRPRISGGT